MSKKPRPPKYAERVFTCGHCGEVTEHFWYGCLLGQGPIHNNNTGRNSVQFNAYEVAQCAHCQKPTLFLNKELSYPVTGLAPPQAEGMPEAIRLLYREASNVVGFSPRAACALLRLAADDLTRTYGAQGEKFNDRIADLVRKGAQTHIQQAFDIARIQGNELERFHGSCSGYPQWRK